MIRCGTQSPQADWILDWAIKAETEYNGGY